MDTLRGFVRQYAAHTAAATTAAAPIIRSVPDRNDPSFELHAYVVPAEGSRQGHPQVDFYEGYWAALIRNTKFANMMGWLKHLLFSPAKLTWRLALVWLFTWILLATALILMTIAIIPWIMSLLDDSTDSSTVNWALQAVSAIGSVALAVATTKVADTLGDAFTYLDNRPGNLAARSTVRRSLVTLLDRLHQDQRYDKIILVGHSLGSVIAYDAMRLLWAKRTMNWFVEDAIRAQMDGMAEISARVTDSEAFRSRLSKAQGTVLTAMSSKPVPYRAGPPWKISHLITLGSPLAYPDLLLTPPGQTLSQMIEEREIPTCPPQLADDQQRSANGDSHRPSFCYQSRSVASQPHPVFIAHHAAPFVATRWTNVFAAGDFIGGPIPAELGAGVNNIRLPTKSLDGRRSWAYIPFKSHSKYWTANAGAPVLNRVLDLEIDGPAC